MRTGRRGKGFVEPSHQITMGEEIHAQERDQIGQAPTETGGQLQIPQEQHRDQCCPKLSLDRIRGSADEGLDLQILFDRLEEQLDLPTILVNRGDGAGAEAVMIGDEDESAAGVLANRLDPTQKMRTLILGSCAGQADGLILDDVPVLRHGVFLDHLEQGVVLHAGDEIDAGIRPFGEQPVIVVAPIIDNDGVRREVHLVSGLDVRHLAIGDDAKARQVPVMVEHQMQLDCALGGAELCPVIHGKAQIDDGRIDADQFVLEAKLLLAHHFGGDRLEQAVEDLLEQFPRSMAVGVGQRRARRRFDAQVSELALATLQPALDLSQGVGSAKLTEQHADELAPARQPLAAVFRSCLFHDAFKIGAWNKLEHLAEHAA